MAKHVWTMLCRRVLIDSSTQLASMLDVVENIDVTGPDLDAVHAKGERIVLPVELTVASMWTRSDSQKGERFTERIQIIDPDGKVIGTGQADADLEKFDRAKNISPIPGLPATGYGTYWFRVQLLKGDKRWETVANVPLGVRKGPSSMPPTQ